MSGTKQGGKSAAQKNKEKYGPDFYKQIGALGGKSGRTGGFASQKPGKDGLTGQERARLAGEKGGKISKRRPTSKPRKSASAPKTEVLAAYKPEYELLPGDRKVLRRSLRSLLGKVKV